MFCNAFKVLFHAGSFTDVLPIGFYSTFSRPIRLFHILQRFALARIDGIVCNNAMVAYSLDLRARLVDAVERQIGSKRKIADLFGVHESFLYKLLRQKRDRGDIAPLPHGGGARAKLSADHLRQLPALVAATPDATLDELREQLAKKARVAVSLSTICRSLQALGLARKKSPRARPKPTPPRAPPSKSSKRRWRGKT